MKQTQDEVRKFGRHKKRKFGTTQGGFFSLAINDSIGPDEVLRQEGYSADGWLFPKPTTTNINNMVKKMKTSIDDQTKSVPGSPQLKRAVGAAQLCERIREETAKVRLQTNKNVRTVLLTIYFISIGTAENCLPRG